MIVNAELVPFGAGQLHDSRLREAWNLRGDSDVEAVFGHVYCAVHRLHRRVRKKWLLINGFDLARRPRNRRGGITVVPRHRAGLFRSGDELGNDVGRGQFCVRTRVPLHSRGSETLLGGPDMNSYDRDSVVQSNNLTDAWNRFRLRFI